MSTPGSKLEDKQERAIIALLACSTHAEAAQQAGMSLPTIQRWLLLPAFQGAYREARRQLLEGAIARLQQTATQAGLTLIQNLAAPRPADQIRAALGILDQSFKGAQLLDLQARIEDLERLLESAEGPSSPREEDGDASPLAEDAPVDAQDEAPADGR